MGGTTFDHYAPGANVADAFRDASDEAAYEHGHGGYTGTLAEKPSYVVITNTPMLEAEAYKLAHDLIDKGDPRIDDKWGPAGAIPVVKSDRTVNVTGFAYTEGQEGSLEEAVKPLVKLRKGETIKNIWVSGYSSPTPAGYGRVTRRMNCSAQVTIAKPPTTRTQTLTVKISGPGPASGMDYQAEDRAIRKAVTDGLRLKKNESVVGYYVKQKTPGKPKVTAVAPKGGTETRYTITNSQHSRWETGLKSQAEARAKATELANNPPRFNEGRDLTFEVEGVTRRADGQPLVRVARSIADFTVEVEVTIKFAEVGQQNPDGWLFFGWASC